jgi:VWFA-related protein
MRRLALTLVAAAVLCAPPTASAQDPAPKFTSSVDVVSVTAVVRDRKGRFVRDLDRGDFVVSERGQQRPILDFRSESDGPVKIALLVDVSGSMRVGSKAVDARQAARQLFSALKGKDAAALFAFDTRLVRVTGFTSDVAALEAAMERVDPPYGQTSLYDAVADTARAVLEEAKNAGGLPQRTAVIVLTDGVDTKSRLSPEQVAGIASAIDIPVYVFAVLASVDDSRESPSELHSPDVESPLRNLARWTGGELFTASAPAHASVAARQIIDELRHQYVLAFASSPNPGWHPLEVRARDRALIVRARAGYTAGSPAGENADREAFEGISDIGNAVVVDRRRTR